MYCIRRNLRWWCDWRVAFVNLLIFSETTFPHVSIHRLWGFLAVAVVYYFRSIYTWLKSNKVRKEAKNHKCMVTGMNVHLKKKKLKWILIKDRLILHVIIFIGAFDGNRMKWVYWTLKREKMFWRNPGIGLLYSPAFSGTCFAFDEWPTREHTKGAVCDFDETLTRRLVFPPSLSPSLSPFVCWQQD